MCRLVLILNRPVRFLNDDMTCQIGVGVPVPMLLFAEQLKPDKRRTRHHAFIPTFELYNACTGIIHHSTCFTRTLRQPEEPTSLQSELYDELPSLTCIPNQIAPAGQALSCEAWAIWW